MQVTVRAGDTLWYYSQLFQLPLILILDSNPEVDPARLSIGQEVNIPGYVLTSHTIQAGESFWELARRQGLAVDALLLVNQGVDPRRLQVGQSVRLPVRVTWLTVTVERPYDYAVLEEDISRLVAIYPFLRLRSIGRSVMGRAINELSLGRGEKRIHMNGAFHANEWITTPVLMRFLNQYLLALTTGTPIRGWQMLPLYQQTLLSLVPMVNPDGVDLVINGPPQEEPYRSQVLEINGGSTDFSGWKANIRGVDLNNQFPAEWETEAERKPKHPAPRDYPGSRPLSEPETIAIADFTRQGEFDRALAFHTQGEVIFWGYLGLEPAQSEILVTEFSRVSGYRPIRYVDSYAGYKDWFIAQWRRPGFTVELGRGVNPLPLNQFPEMYERALGIMLASLYL